jgi:hypothetical protein
METSGLVARKSWLSTLIWLSICACEMFCAAVFQTTWTTTGIRAIPAKRCWRATYCRVWFSSADRAAAYSGEVDSSLRCASITPQLRWVG